MSAKTAEFVLSAPAFKDCPPETLPEVCFAGRSNVGKSSLINAVVGRKKLVKTSNVPGKTRAMNYFRIDEQWFLVDLPGYGYAKVSKSERERWDTETRTYFKNRGALRLVISCVDSRHEPQKLDEDFVFWLGSNGIPFAIVLTKSDKLTANQKQTATSRVRRMLKNMNMEVPVLLTSSEDKDGIEQVRELISDFVNNNYDTD
ncbi:MAG: YihA family ribosome biogenesis GTP-binding protein [Bacteroidetes bacterium]|nr:YihA family ribosome biogenesis GTP-binding protein [Bacteroidota bacterium]MCH8523757.1 ribosome biogenesis GTP-binding protein YihA/YsxC [Balneolales bacterium]